MRLFISVWRSKEETKGRFLFQKKKTSLNTKHKCCIFFMIPRLRCFQIKFVLKATFISILTNKFLSIYVNLFPSQESFVWSLWRYRFNWSVRQLIKNLLKWLLICVIKYSLLELSNILRFHLYIFFKNSSILCWC